MAFASLYSGLKSPTPNEYNIAKVLTINLIAFLLKVVHYLSRKNYNNKKYNLTIKYTYFLKF